MLSRPIHVFTRGRISFCLRQNDILSDTPHTHTFPWPFIHRAALRLLSCLGALAFYSTDGHSVSHQTCSPQTAARLPARGLLNEVRSCKHLFEISESRCAGGTDPLRREPRRRSDGETRAPAPVRRRGGRRHPRTAGASVGADDVTWRRWLPAMFRSFRLLSRSACEQRFGPQCCPRLARSKGHRALS